MVIAVNAQAILDVTGFLVLPGIVSEAQCAWIASLLAGRQTGAGTRDLLEEDWCASLAATLRDTFDLGQVLTDMVAVQCTYFDKSAQGNWLVPLHQDLGIPVAEHVDSPELQGWSIKQGVHHVQPPASLLTRMTAVRVHLDESAEDNGPLRVIPGSHLAGRLQPEEMGEFRRIHGEVLCTTPRGGVVALKPLLLHASSKATSNRPRRVLHYLYGPKQLPHGLAWHRAV